MSSEQIGGEGKTVEIDEAKIGKRKYNKGRLVTGQYLVVSNVKVKNYLLNQFLIARLKHY